MEDLKIVVQEYLREKMVIMEVSESYEESRYSISDEYNNKQKEEEDDGPDFDFLPKREDEPKVSMGRKTEASPVELEPTEPT